MRDFTTLTSAACALLLAGCAGNPSSVGETVPTGSFATVKPVLERNCVHCHGSARLAGMPPLSNTQDLSSLIGPGQWIVPGSPQSSRFYLVAALSDDKPGAMPPTGHAVTPEDLATLRAWIEKGAKIPAENTAFTPSGPAPRSR